METKASLVAIGVYVGQQHCGPCCGLGMLGWVLYMSTCMLTILFDLQAEDFESKVT